MESVYFIRQMLRLEKDALELHGGLVLARLRSKSEVCGMCMDVVFNKKNNRDHRFGILPNCSHCFCLGYIRAWREETCLAKNVVISCPDCGTLSHFYISTNYWVVEKDNKQKLIQNHKAYMACKPCNNFNGGNGVCHHGVKCFYNHSLRLQPQPSGLNILPFRSLPRQRDRIFLQ